MNPALALTLAMLIWGAGPPVFKLALTNIPLFTLAFLRFFLGGFIFLPLAHRTAIRRLTSHDWFAILAVALSSITVNIGFYFLGLKYADSINASIIAASAPIFIFLVSVFWFGQRAKLRMSLGMMIAFIGVLVLVLSPLLKGQSLASGEWKGNIFYIIAMLSTVVAPFIEKSALKRINIYVILSISFFIGALTFLPFMMYELTKWNFTLLNWRGAVGIVYGAVFCSALAYWLYFYGLKRLATTEVGIFTYLDPFVTVAVAAPLLHELPGVFYFVSLVLVIVGISIAEGRLHYHGHWQRRRVLPVDETTPFIKET